MNINRQKLIEDIEREFDGVCVYDVSPSQAVSDFIEIVDRQPPADQWIPCSERLPDESMDTNNDGIVTVLVTWEFKDMWFNGCSYCDVVDYDLAFNCFIFSAGKKVTAWKPVEPYKEGEKE